MSEAGAAQRIGVVGAGTMGAGIAQLAALSGAQTVLCDPLPGAIERGAAQLERGLDRGRYERAQAAAARERLSTTTELADLAACDLVIEAIPERLELKHELFAALSELCDGVLATNTSSLPVTAIAAATARPERVVGMHFFNPAPVMQLLEVVAGAASGEYALELARATGRAMERRVIDAADGPGFLVNRCNRPFGLEAMRIVTEGLATFEQVDRICRMAGRFRMGPFELSDLVGVDVGFEVSKSFYELSFGEPRWRPSPLQAQIVAAGRHGRKSARGWYSYDGEGDYRAKDPERPPAGGGDGLIVVAGDSVLAGELREAAREAGWDPREPSEANGSVPYLVIDCGVGEDDDGGPPPQGGPQLLLCDVGPLAELDAGGSGVGFHALPPLADSALVELTRGADSSTLAAERAEHFFATLGKHVEWVGDAPGLVLGRIVCQLVNEASFAVGEGVGSVQDVDIGMTLGLNHPRGPLGWADEIGLDHVLSVIEGLHGHYREERYRPAPLLRSLALSGRIGRHVGAGFHDHETAA
ncbi:MAG: 3-hydroxyacyl-CoA dehydrogenase NAD-binding domain-containing protein [Solirubrobacteraceae bacterium]